MAGAPPTAGASGNDSDVVISSPSQTLSGVDYSSVAANHGARRQMCFVDMRRPDDVHYAFTCGEEVVRDDTPMAAPPDGLGAHDRASVPPTSVSESRQTRCERRRQRVVRIIAKTAHPPISVGRRFRAAHLSAETTKFGDMLIADLPRRQRSRKAFAIELRIGARSRYRPYVDDQVDARRPKQIDEFIDRPGRMAYSEKGARDGPTGEWRSSIRTALPLIVNARFPDQKRPLLATSHNLAMPTTGAEVDGVNCATFRSSFPRRVATGKLG